MLYPQFLRCIWHPLLYNFPSEPQVNLEIRQHPESQCFVVLQCLRSTATTPCLKIKREAVFTWRRFLNRTWMKIRRKAPSNILTHKFFSSYHIRTSKHFHLSHKLVRFRKFHLRLKFLLIHCQWYWTEYPIVATK